MFTISYQTLKFIEDDMTMKKTTLDTQITDFKNSMQLKQML